VKTASVYAGANVKDSDCASILNRTVKLERGKLCFHEIIPYKGFSVWLFCVFFVKKKPINQNKPKKMGFGQ